MIRTVLALLFAAFGTVAAFAAPGDWTRISYPVVAQSFCAQSVNLTNTARAPPLTRANVMATGTAFPQTGNVRVLDGVKTSDIVYASLRSSIAPNTGVVNRFGPLNEGPLPEDTAKTFRSGTYDEVITPEPTTLYRVIGDNGNPAGGYTSGQLVFSEFEGQFCNGLSPADCVRGFEITEDVRRLGDTQTQLGAFALLMETGGLVLTGCGGGVGCALLLAGEAMSLDQLETGLDNIDGGPEAENTNYVQLLMAAGADQDTAQVIEFWTGMSLAAGDLALLATSLPRGMDNLALADLNATNRTFDFTSSGTGNDLRRFTSLDGTDIRINSGHAYNRTHAGGDVSQIGTMDEIESAILRDISANSRLGSLQPRTTQTHTVQVNGQTVGYSLADTPVGANINYYPVIE